MINFTTLLREDERAYVVTIPITAVIDFLRGGTPSVVLVDGVEMEFRFAKLAREQGNCFVNCASGSARSALII